MQCFFLQKCSHMLSKSPACHVLFHRHKKRMGFCQFPQAVFIQWHGKSCIYHRCRDSFFCQFFSYLPGGFHHRTDRKKCNLCTLGEYFRTAFLNRCPLIFPEIAGFSARITDRHRFLCSNRILEHIGKLPFVFRSHNRQVRNT